MVLDYSETGRSIRKYRLARKLKQRDLRINEMTSLLACMDDKKLHLCIEICRLVAESDK